MKDKHQMVMNELLCQLEEPYRDMFLELAEYAVVLGYCPVRNKTQDITIDFRNNKVKKTILKMEQYEQKHDGCKYKETTIPGLRLRFFAAKEYSDIFSQGIKRVIEDFGGKYTGCYGCGRCDGTQGYIYTYEDGRSVFRCGSELVSVFHYKKDNLSEIKELMKTQAEYYNKEA
ncbi:hypothetical protein [Anaerocolumna chitinilytica]|uniref:Uncharacterized protein n=1 Tax=Anaerocolumna chitinilytica TaxID=1727145 RepID=A0A7I8DMC6_9FIRM|nr:hypothetical protein [Anaerocolumna chitinilytica]BCJ99529.1 hypothetical protein bsdcttw_25700 [Anaerocolumna chitinilytica]